VIILAGKQDRHAPAQGGHGENAAPLVSGRRNHPFLRMLKARSNRRALYSAADFAAFG
jgi:hypothetical protein